MVPNWIRIAKVLPKSSSSKPKKRCTSSRWPVEDTGRNSVRPSTTPRTNALKRSNVITGSADGLITQEYRAAPRAGDWGNQLFPHHRSRGNREGRKLHKLLYSSGRLQTTVPANHQSAAILRRKALC